MPMMTSPARRKGPAVSGPFCARQSMMLMVDDAAWDVGSGDAIPAFAGMTV
jgi:hypothetical protein